MPASYTRTPPSALGRLLRERREAQSLELYELGKRSGVGASTIQKWESGAVSEPPLRGVLRLAHVLRIPYTEVVAAALEVDVSELHAARHAASSSHASGSGGAGDQNLGVREAAEEGTRRRQQRSSGGQRHRKPEPRD